MLKFTTVSTYQREGAAVHVALLSAEVWDGALVNNVGAPAILDGQPCVILAIERYATALHRKGEPIGLIVQVSPPQP